MDRIIITEEFDLIWVGTWGNRENAKVKSEVSYYSTSGQGTRVLQGYRCGFSGGGAVGAPPSPLAL